MRLAAILAWGFTLAPAGAAPGAMPEDISPISQAEKLPVGKLTEPWVYASQTSAVIHWQTENRARSCVAYGPTRRCEARTPLSGDSSVSRLPHWTQFHRVTGLQPGREYFYRTVCVGTDGNEVLGDVRAFQTRKLAEAVPLPGSLAGPPYVLDRPGATYVLTEDLTCPAGGIEIKAADVTLDLDGHALVYNERPAEGPPEWSKRAYGDHHDFGVKVTTSGPVRIVNGVIAQGKGNSAGTQVGIGCNPVYSRGAPVELAGVEVIWSGADVSGLFFHWGAGSRVHHCVLEDRGSVVTNRHQAISTVDGNAYGHYHHNLVKRTRQQGFPGAAAALHNEIYVDSCATNAFGIVGSARSPGPVEIAHNRIIGIGEHPVGIAMFGAYAAGTCVHDNLVEVKCTRSGAEYGYTGSACFRTTWGADNLDVRDNTFIAHADVYDGKAAKARAVWVGLPKFTPKDANKPIEDARAVFRGNYIAALGRRGAKAGGICVVCLNESPNLVFRDNTVVSTWGNVLLGDEYGHAGGYPKFWANTFQRAGEQGDYRTIRHEYAGRPGTGVFLDNSYDKGADEDSVRLQKGGEIVFQAGVCIEVRDPGGRALGDALVEVRDRSGKVVFSAVTADRGREVTLDSSGGASLSLRHPADRLARGCIDSLSWEKGTVCAVLTRYTRTSEGRQQANPYMIAVRKPGYAPAARVLWPDAPKRADRAVIVLTPAKG